MSRWTGPAIALAISAFFNWVDLTFPWYYRFPMCFVIAAVIVKMELLPAKGTE